MMDATLKFSLPEERAEHEMAVNAGKYAALLGVIVEDLRGKRKHGHPFKTPAQVLDYYWQLIFREATEDGLTI